MERIVTVEEMRQAEKNVMEGWGLSSLILMERAAAFAAREIEKAAGGAGSAVILCGMGNNGGDGLALGRILYERGWEVQILTVGDAHRASRENQIQKGLLEKCLLETLPGQGQKGPKKLTMGEFKTEEAGAQEAAVYVDAMLGIGGDRPLEGEFARAAAWMNEKRGLKVCLDIPTGIGSGSGVCRPDEKGEKCCVQADLTLTFGAYKPGVLLYDGRIAAGRAICDTCGIFYGKETVKAATKTEKSGYYGYRDADGFILSAHDVGLLIRRDPLGNKGTFGKLFFWAGNERMAGAALMAVRAAFLAGAGYIRLLSDEKNKALILPQIPELVFAEADQPGSGQAFADGIRFGDVVAAGCGIGTDEGAEKRLKALLRTLSESTKKPLLLLDADALGLIAGNDRLWGEIRRTGCKTIITPHMAEFARLSGKTIEEIRQSRIEIGREFAAGHETVLVLKDSETLIVSPDGKYSINPTGNDGMAVAGSGDVLTGIIAAMAGRLKEPFISACAGVYLHGAAGDKAARRLGKDSMRPSDLTAELPAVLMGLAGEKSEALK